MQENKSIPLWTKLLLCLSLLGFCTLDAQQNLILETMPLADFNASIPTARTSAAMSYQARVEAGELDADVQMVRLDLGDMLSNTPVVIELKGKRYPVVKSQHWIDPEAPDAFSVSGYLKGDKSLPFFFNHGPSGEVNMTFQTPETKHYFTHVEGEWFVVYSYAGDYDAKVQCGDGEEHEVQMQEEGATQGNKTTAPGNQCKIRTVFLYTDQVEVGYTALSNALNQNINFINSNVLQNGNGRNPVITSYAPSGCNFEIERVALIKTNANPYGSYTEVTCPVEANGNVMRDQMRDGLAGQGSLSWLQTLRKDYAADLIVMLTSNELRSSTGSCSDGANLNGIAGGIGVGRNASVIVQRAVGTFLDNSQNADASNLTLVHELGHNLGCSHEGQDATYQGYCDAAAPQKTIMHTLNGTAPCDNGRNERRAVFSHNIHTFGDGAAAGSNNHKNASRVGGNFESNAEFFEDGNSGSNNLTYSGDFANNSGRLRRINTPGYVVLSYARNSGSTFVKVEAAEYVYVTGDFSSKRISLIGIPNNASKTSAFVFDEASQAEELDAQLEGQMADRLLMANLYPNPTRGDAQLTWFLSGKSPVSLRIFDASGALIKEVLDAEYPEGDHSMALPVADLPAGMYLVQLRAGEEQQTLRLLRQ